jgi:hypothetical protein
MNLLLTSCVEEPEAPKIEVNENAQIAQVKSWFEQNKTNLRLPERGSNFRTESQELILPFFEKEPDWDKFHHYYFPDGREVFEISLENATKYFPTSMADSFPGRNPAEVVIQNIMFVKHQSLDRFDPLIARYYPANSINEKSFEEINYLAIDNDWSGTLELFTYDEHHFVGFEIQEGEVIRNYTFTPHDGNKTEGLRIMDVRCTTTYIAVGYETCAGSYCHTTIERYIAQTSCSGSSGIDNSGNYGFPSGDSGSGGTANTDGNGTCSTCDYNPPSIPRPSFKIKNTISPDDYPCLRSGVNNAIKENFSNEIQKLILDIFGESEDFNIEIEAIQLDDDEDGIFNPGIVFPDASYVNFTISINSLLEKYITATIFHEFLHAYIAYLELPNLRPTDQSDHEEMATKYLDKLSSVLINQYGISKSHAEALSWGGLGKTEAYKKLYDSKKIYIGQINQAYRDANKGTKCN